MREQATNHSLPHHFFSSSILTAKEEVFFVEKKYPKTLCHRKNDVGEKIPFQRNTLNLSHEREKKDNSSKLKNLRREMRAFLML